MLLLSFDDFDTESRAYRLFGLGRDAPRWTVEDLLAQNGFVDDRRLNELGWRLASSGYYTEQAGLTAAADLAVQTDDPLYRFSLATAVSDEARHADAFLTYARAVGGEPDDCREAIKPLDDTLESLSFDAKAVLHTLLEGVAADQFLLLADIFVGDALGELYRHVRRDEIRHIAIGLDYLTRRIDNAADVDEARAENAELAQLTLQVVNLDQLSEGLSPLTGIDAATLSQWFARRHRDRLRAAGVIDDEKGGELRHEDPEGADEKPCERHVSVQSAD